MHHHFHFSLNYQIGKAASHGMEFSTISNLSITQVSLHSTHACMKVIEKQSETIKRLDHLFRDCLRLLAVFLHRLSTVIGCELGLIRLIAASLPPPAFPCQTIDAASMDGSKILFLHLHLCLSNTHEGLFTYHISRRRKGEGIGMTS